MSQLGGYQLVHWHACTQLIVVIFCIFRLDFLCLHGLLWACPSMHDIQMTRSPSNSANFLGSTFFFASLIIICIPIWFSRSCILRNKCWLLSSLLRFLIILMCSFERVLQVSSYFECVIGIVHTSGLSIWSRKTSSVTISLPFSLWFYPCHWFNEFI